MTTRRGCLAAVAALAAHTRPSRAQQAWPADRPIEVIVPTPPGGSLDAMVRLLLPFAQARIPGARFFASSRPGAGGQVGFEAVFNAAPDGYTLGASTIPALTSFPLERAVRYRPLDFTFVANVVEDPSCFYVRTESPIRSVATLVETAKARPGQMTYGSTGVGSDDHIFMMAFEELTGVPAMVNVPFAGSAPLIPQLLGGHLDLAAINVGDALALMREGKLRCLAQASPGRWEAAADVPTFRELGLDLVAGASRGVIAPPGMPQEAARTLERAFGEAMADPAFRREAERAFMPLRPLVGAEFRQMAVEAEKGLQGLWQRRPWRG